MKHMHFPAILAAVLTIGVSGAALAQGPGGPPPFPPGGGPGGPGFGPGGPGGRMGGPRAVTVATMPLEVLETYLGLSSDQANRIEKIVEKMRSQMPRPPQPGGPGGPGGQGGERPQPPSREEMEAQRTKMQVAEKAASKEIEAVLTAGQKAKLPPLMKAFGALRTERISPNGIAQMKLTEAQLAKLAALGERPERGKVASILTAEQKEIADLNRQQFGPGGPGGPGFGPGGPGGRGGRGGGGFPGGPPPPGGEGFPPPPPGA
jgi:P pilus assembly/Cpx signaling pathway, periplasmic inhibitor/zinc-resistance associated protein